MDIRKLILAPDKASYSQTPGSDVDSVKLEGGESWFRLDSLGSARNVNVQWTCGPDEYKYLMLFHKAATVSGVLPFKIDLLLDDWELTEHTAHFVPDTIGLKSHSGLTYIVGAVLEVIPTDTTEDDLKYVSIFTRYGPKWRTRFDRFDKLVNVTLPNAQRNQ